MTELGMALMLPIAIMGVMLFLGLSTALHMFFGLSLWTVIVIDIIVICFLVFLSKDNKSTAERMFSNLLKHILMFILANVVLGLVVMVTLGWAIKSIPLPLSDGWKLVVGLGTIHTVVFVYAYSQTTWKEFIDDLKREHYETSRYY